MTVKDQTKTEPRAYFAPSCLCLWHIGGVDAKGTLPGSPTHVRDAIDVLCPYPGHRNNALIKVQPPSGQVP